MRVKLIIVVLFLVFVSFVYVDLFEVESLVVCYLLGVLVVEKFEYDGVSWCEIKFRLLWVLKFGCVCISILGVGGLLGFGYEEVVGGVSIQFIDIVKLCVGIVLCVDSGCSSGDVSIMWGLFDVKCMLWVCFYMNYSFIKNFNIGVMMLQDFFGYQGGMMLGVDLGWCFYCSEMLEWISDVGILVGNVQNLNIYFGVLELVVQVSGKLVYWFGVGLCDVYFGVGFIWLFSKYWIVYGNVGVSCLIGLVVDSLLVEWFIGILVGIGLVWRNQIGVRI